MFLNCQTVSRVKVARPDSGLEVELGDVHERHVKLGLEAVAALHDHVLEAEALAGLEI